MGLYDNAWPHVYEEIKRFYPVWYRDVLEMDAIWRAQGTELDGVRATVEALIDNGYIMTADLRTIISLEAFLHIHPTPSQTLQERRQVVATYVRGQDHIGAPEIKSIAGAFTSGVVDVEFALGIISVMVSHPVTETFDLDACRALLLARIPAHLSLALVEVISTMQAADLRFLSGMGKGHTETTLPEAPLDYGHRAPVLLTSLMGKGFSQTGLPEIAKDYNHRAFVTAASYLGKGYTETALPEVSKDYGLTAVLITGGAFSTYTSTALPAAE